MVGNTIATLRKRKALSQQQLADRMNVVRQTVSKWEKDLSVPDAEALVRLADALDVTVAELLGQPVKEEAAPADYSVVLAQMTEQLAITNRRRSLIWKIVAWVLGIVLAIHVLLIIVGAAAGVLYAFDEESFSESAGVVEVVDQYDDETSGADDATSAE